MEYILYYLIAVNIVAFVLCFVDKQRAIRGQWRISEKALFAVTLIGGALGMYFTMLKVRHKTQHKRFMVGLPLIIIAQTICIFILLDKLMM